MCYRSGRVTCLLCSALLRLVNGRRKRFALRVHGGDPFQRFPRRRGYASEYRDFFCNPRRKRGLGKDSAWMTEKYRIRKGAVRFFLYA